MSYQQETDLDLAVLAPDIATQKWYRDALIDPTIIGLFDFNLTDLVPAGVLPNAQELKNVVDTLGSAYTRAANIARDHGGLVCTSNVVLAELPANFQAGAAAKHRGFCHWLKLNAADMAAASYYSSMGCGTGSSTDNQWVFQWHATTAGVPDQLSFLCDGGTSAIIGNSATIASLGIFNGSPHQIAGEWEVINSDTQIVRRLYVDAVLVASSTATWDGNILQPVGASHYPKIGAQGGFNALRGTYYRPWAADLSIAGGRSFADSLALDYAMNGSQA